MTKSEAIEIAVLLELVRKRCSFAWQNARIDDKGRAMIDVITNASQPTITEWFKQTTCCVTRVEQIPGQIWQTVWFDWK